MITISEYIKKYVNPKIDLEVTNKICCPFHTEDTPSFSYNAERNIWRCFGECDMGGDVFDLHRLARRLKTREEAIADLSRLEGEKYDKSLLVKEYTETDAKMISILNRLKMTSDINEIRDIIYKCSKYPIDM